MFDRRRKTRDGFGLSFRMMFGGLLLLLAMACGLPTRSLPPTSTPGSPTVSPPTAPPDTTPPEESDVVTDNTIGGLDPSAPAEFGFVWLDSGFTPEAHTVSLLSGGDQDASLANSACSGFVSVVPDYELTWGGGGDLRIFFVGDSDATLVILGPGGQWYCNDDFNGIHPYLLFNSADSGVYDIWIGTNGGGGRISGTLYITEGMYDPNTLP